jgi:hypothetical protein
MKAFLLLKTLLTSVISVSLALSAGALGVYHGYFFVNPALVSYYSVWPAQPSTFLNICPTFSPMSSRTLSIQLKGETAS